MRILHLYPNEMATYGDSGNVLTISRRLEWHGYTPQIVEHHRDGPMASDVDVVIGGGGQDSGQIMVAADLVRHGDTLRTLADQDVPMLVVCGLYQLFGRSFEMADGTVVDGVGIFGADTTAGSNRLTGNVVAGTRFGELVGYENHSGRTFLDVGQPPLGTVERGAGNNDEDKSEGAVVDNVYGTYLHGPVLPRNPAFADHLIARAVIRRHGEFHAGVTDDAAATRVRVAALVRPR